MTPADAIAALRRAFPAIADEGVERFRRELEPPPVWMPEASAMPCLMVLREAGVDLADVWPGGVDRWHWRAYLADDWLTGFAATRDDAMRAEAAIRSHARRLLELVGEEP